MRTIIRGAHLVDPASGVDGINDVLIDGCRVEAVGERIEATGAETVDATGLHLFPGLIDIHVHLREPGQEYKEDIASGTRAAAAGGFTGVCAMPNTAPVNDNAEVTRYILEQTRLHGVARVYPVGAISKGLKGEDLAAIGEMAQAGCVAVTDDGMPVCDAMLMRRGMEYAKGFGLPVISHSEDLSLVGGGVMNEGAVSTVLGLPATPAEAEEVMVIRDILLARLTGAKLHLAHLSTRGSVEFLRRAKADGINVTGESGPHYFTLTDEAVRSFDADFKMNPPLRSATDRDAIIEGLRDATLDAIATDHAPHAPDEKETEFEAAPNGVIGLETSLALALALHFDHGLPLSRVVAALTCGPASALGLLGGRLSPGNAADLVLVDLNAKWTVEPDKFQSKSKNCPFKAMELRGRVMRTMVAGRTVYRDGEITADNLSGAEIL